MAEMLIVVMLTGGLAGAAAMLWLGFRKRKTSVNPGSQGTNKNE